MRYSDERRKAIRALQVLGFSFPPDIKRTAETLQQLKYEHLLAIREAYREEFPSFLTVMDDLVSRSVHTYCDVCDKDEYTYDDIPQGWGWYDGQVKWYMMCNDCQQRYTEKFGKVPEVKRDI